MSPELLNPIVTYSPEEGKNIFIEKTPGISVEETRRWVDLACNTGFYLSPQGSPFAH